MRMKEAEGDAVTTPISNPCSGLSKAVLRGMMKARSAASSTSLPWSVRAKRRSNQLCGVEGRHRGHDAVARAGDRQPRITVNCVAPGFIDTDMTRTSRRPQREALLEQIPLGRLGKPEDVAAVSLFLASPQAGYITGTTLHVKRGMYMS